MKKLILPLLILSLFACNDDTPEARPDNDPTIRIDTSELKIIDSPQVLSKVYHTDHNCVLLVDSDGLAIIDTAKIK
jgi:hypothetical protein